MATYIETYNLFFLNEIWLYSLTNQIYLITLLMVFSLVAYLFIKNRKTEAFSLTTSEQYHFLQAVTKNSDTADFIIDRDHVLKFANEHFLELFSLDDENIDNKSISEIKLPKKLKAFIQSQTNSDGNKSVQLTINNHKFSCRKAPVTTHDGQFLGSLIKISDHVLTGKGKSEAGKWLHEINTPLNAIVGYSEILKKQDGLTDELKSYLETINMQSFMLKSKIEHLLSDHGSNNIVSSENHSEIKDILIVDDVPINRTVLKIMLKRMGYNVKEAVNGKEAIDFFEKEPVDLILMDISMPVMNGLEAAKHIRKQGYTLHDLPIIAVTASSFYNNRETLQSKGFNALLKKPFKEADLTDILKTVNTHLN